MRAWVLLTLSPKTGTPTLPVGFLAVDGDRHAFAGLPWEPYVDWELQVAHRAETAGLSDATVDEFLAESCGQTFGAIELDAEEFNGDQPPQDVVGDLLDGWLISAAPE